MIIQALVGDDDAAIIVNGCPVDVWNPVHIDVDADPQVVAVLLEDQIVNARDVRDGREPGVIRDRQCVSRARCIEDGVGRNRLSEGRAVDHAADKVLVVAVSTVKMVPPVIADQLVVAAKAVQGVRAGTAREQVVRCGSLQSVIARSAQHDHLRLIDCSGHDAIVAARLHIPSGIGVVGSRQIGAAPLALHIDQVRQIIKHLDGLAAQITHVEHDAGWLALENRGHRRRTGLTRAEVLALFVQAGQNNAVQHRRGVDTIGEERIRLDRSDAVEKIDLLHIGCQHIQGHPTVELALHQHVQQVGGGAGWIVGVVGIGKDAGQQLRVGAHG